MLMPNTKHRLLAQSIAGRLPDLRRHCAESSSTSNGRVRLPVPFLIMLLIAFDIFSLFVRRGNTQEMDGIAALVHADDADLQAKISVHVALQKPRTLRSGHSWTWTSSRLAAICTSAKAKKHNAKY